MTEPLHSDDEMLSAWLDDELSADERAALEARFDEPDVAARLAALRTARDLVATPVPSPAAALDAARAAALAASATSVVVTDLTAARTRRRMPRVLVAAAAAVAVVALAVPVVGRLGDGGSETADAAFTGNDTGDTAEGGGSDDAGTLADGALAPLDAESASTDLAADDAARDTSAGDAAEFGDAGDSSESGDEVDASATGEVAPLGGVKVTTAGPLGGDLGDHPSAAALGAAVLERLARAASTTTTVTEAPTAPTSPPDPFTALVDVGIGACPAVFDGLLATVQDRAVTQMELATATIVGRPVVVIVGSTPDPELVLLVDLDGCTVSPLPLG